MNRYAEKLDFTGKNVIVTGALSGAGREISRVFIESGANVILTFNHSYRGSEWFMENYPTYNDIPVFDEEGYLMPKVAIS